MDPKNSYFETRLSYEPSRDAIWKVIVRYLQRYIPNNSRILELGAGYCSFINHVEAQEKHALDQAEITASHAAENVKVHIQDCSNLRSFPNNAFDVIFSSFLFEHLTRAQLDNVIRESRRILRTGGVLITLLPNYKYIYRHYFDDYTHLQVFSHVSFADYLKSHGYELISVQGRFLPYTFKSRFPKSPFLTKIYLKLFWRPFAGNMLVVARNPAQETPTATSSESTFAKQYGDRSGRSATVQTPPEKKQAFKTPDTTEVAPAEILKDRRKPRIRHDARKPVGVESSHQEKRDSGINTDRKPIRKHYSPRKPQSQNTSQSPQNQPPRDDIKNRRRYYPRKRPRYKGPDKTGSPE
ncbi:class I SAM-dependent methyltransferase [bacterium]|nr:class I SAM-dependent methyltransferase [candidate division CSSED10-310 bacterium]